MDKQSFDERLKEKLAGLEPQFNPGAWDEMEELLDFSKNAPWYVGWQKPLLYGGLAAMVLLNIFLWLRQPEIPDADNAFPQQLAENTIIRDTIYRVDTIYIQPPIAASGIQRSFGNTPILNAVNSYYSQNPKQYNSYGLVNDKQSLLYTDFQYAANDIEDLAKIDDDDFDIYEWWKSYSMVFEPDGVTPPSSPRKTNYYKQKTGMKIGLIGGFWIPDPDIGERYLSQQFGIITELEIKNNLYFRTGLISHDFTYKLDDVDDDNFQPEDLQKYPGYQDLTKSPNDIVINNELLQVPLQVRYYKPLNYNWSVFLSGGPNIDILLNQTFAYNYIDIEGGQLVSRNETEKVEQARVYLSTLGGALGFEHQFSKQFSAQMNVEYQFGISKLGVEKRSVNSLSLNLGAYYKLK